MLLTLGGLVVGIPAALLVGALSFKNSYRDIGSADGHVIVVQQFAGWDTDDGIGAGYREGPFVNFQSRGNSYLKRPKNSIGAWYFTITRTSTAVLVRYHAGEQPHQAGTLTLPRLNASDSP